MADEHGFQVVKDSGWLSGLENMLRQENGRWWNTRKWLVQSVIWVLLLNGLHALVLQLRWHVGVLLSFK